MKRISLIVYLVTFSVFNVYAQRTPVVWGACGTAKVDGVLSPGEWDAATAHDITINTADGPVTGTLYVMYDNLTLYVALKYPESAPSRGGFSVKFDSSDDGSPTSDGDLIEYDHAALTGFFDKYIHDCAGMPCAALDTVDPNVPGSTEGRGAFVNDGVNSVYEISHPFNSADTAHDLSICWGVPYAPLPPFICRTTTVGFYISNVTTDTSGNSYLSTYPSFNDHDRIQFDRCAVPALSGCGTSSVDGTIHATEWSGAGQYRFSINTTDRGDTTPATLYLMNDSFNLYLGLAVDQPSADAQSSIGIRFNTTPVIDQVFFGRSGQTSTFIDEVFVPCPIVGLPCSTSDLRAGGTSDGVGAFSNDGTISAYEISHPFNSGDADDMSLTTGASVPYHLGFGGTNDPTNQTSFVTSFPTLGGPTDTAIWTLCTPTPVQAVQDLSQNVGSLESTGTLSAKNATALQSDLSKSNADLVAGKTKQASQELGHFIDSVTKLMRKGDLASRYGQPLINAANSAMSQL